MFVSNLNLFAFKVGLGFAGFSWMWKAEISCLSKTSSTTSERYSQKTKDTSIFVLARKWEIIYKIVDERFMGKG